MSSKSVIRMLAGVALASVFAGAGAQSTDALVDKYTVLAGSKESARLLVNGLRSSTDFKIDGTSFDTPTQKLGNGEVNIALSLAEATLAKQNIDTPSATQLKGALEPILEQRAGGKGWGEIANGMGIRLGELMRSDRARSENRLARIERGDKSLQRPERADKPERPDRAERPERPERPEKPERPGR